MNPESLTSATFAAPSGRPASILKDSASVKAEKTLPRSGATLLTGDSESPLADVVGKLVAVGNGEEPQVNGTPRKLRNLQLLLKE
nr:hypothetical protein CFP56_29296 [Quercus suber]